MIERQGFVFAWSPPEFHFLSLETGELCKVARVPVSSASNGQFFSVSMDKGGSGQIVTL